MRYSKKEIQNLERRARNWVSTSEGKKAIKDHAQSLRKELNKLEKARQVDPKRLNQPVTL